MAYAYRSLGSTFEVYEKKTLRTVQSDLSEKVASMMADALNRETDGWKEKAREMLDSVASAFVTLPDDFSLDHRKAWIYGILFGWGDGDTRIAARHGWNQETLERLRTMRRRYQWL